MDEDEDGGVGTTGPVNVELFDLSRSVGRALRGADTGARCVAVAVKALTHPSYEGFVIHLVVRCIQFDLVVIHLARISSKTDLTPARSSGEGRPMTPHPHLGD